MIEEKAIFCHKLNRLIPVDSVQSGGGLLNGGIN